MAGKRDPYRDRDVVKKMAQLMMQGAVMLSETCPICGLPLFRLRSGEVVCPVHGRIIMVRSDEEAREVEVDSIVREVEHYAARKVQSLMEDGSPGEILEWMKIIEAGERIREIRDRRRLMQAQAGQGRVEEGRKGKGGSRG
ncbi:MAG: hypothetical protein GSR73_04045 [Desulfurococcales archaeon]|nr:hypothetical protein [Desulfurococcales archaeon]